MIVAVEAANQSLSRRRGLTVRGIAALANPVGEYWLLDRIRVKLAMAALPARDKSVLSPQRKSAPHARPARRKE